MTNENAEAIKQIISEHKHTPRTKYGKQAYRPKPGMKRIMAIVQVRGELVTRHMDVQK